MIVLQLCAVAVLSTLALADLCNKCACSHVEILDCTYLTLEDHFSSSEWEGTSETAAYFDHNNIIHLRAFPKLPLTRLSITHNAIVKIDPVCFKQLENLTELDLSHNQLTSDQLLPNVFQGHYAPEAYEPLRNLRVLRLSANALHSLDADLFEHLPQLEHLSLNSNPLKVIDRQTIIALTSINFLKFLDLSSTSLRNFPDLLLHTPRFLEILNLSANLFTSPPQALEDSHHLKQLYLDDNPITNLTNFPNLPDLEVLSLSWMSLLEEIGPHSLSGLTSLEELYCSNNHRLTKISGTALSKPVVGVPSGQYWPPVKKMTLNNNKLGYLDLQLVDHWEHLELLDIQNNPWVCECHNQWLVSSLVPLLERNNSTRNSITGIVCHEPDAMRGRSIADLDHRSYQMRCLDLYGRHPENDASLLVGAFIGVILAIPLTSLVLIMYRRRLNTTAALYHRAFYKRGESFHEFTVNPSS